jgi:hypothetical protein
VDWENRLRLCLPETVTDAAKMAVRRTLTSGEPAARNSRYSSASSSPSRATTFRRHHASESRQPWPARRPPSPLKTALRACQDLPEDHPYIMQMRATPAQGSAVITLCNRACRRWLVPCPCCGWARGGHTAPTTPRRGRRHRLGRADGAVAGADRRGPCVRCGRRVAASGAQTRTPSRRAGQCAGRCVTRGRRSRRRRRCAGRRTCSRRCARARHNA